METSENRRERLKAMRLEAEASHNDTTADVPGFLSNPLADGDVVQEEPCAPSRFGFNTDPMAGFSTNTKRCKVGDQIASTSFKHSDASGLPMPRFLPPNLGRPRNPEMPPPSHQFQSHYTPDQRMYQQNFVPQRTPAGMVRPLAMHHGNPPDVWNGAEGQASYNFPSDPSSRFPSPGYRPPGSLGYEPPGSPGYRPPRNPGFGPLGNRGSGPPGSPGFGPPGSPGFRPPGSPGYGPPASAGYSSHSLQGRGHLVSHGQIPYGVHGGSHSPSSSSGRGRGRHGSGSDRGGRELHSHDRPFDPKRFYNASMVEDPWKGLAPVTWTASPPLIQKFLDTPSNGNKNKASISEYSNKSTPQPNLAEFLAASFKETIDEAPKS